MKYNPGLDSLGIHSFLEGRMSRIYTNKVHLVFKALHG